MLEVLPALKYSSQIPLPASPPTLQAKQTPLALASTDRGFEHTQGYSQGQPVQISAPAPQALASKASASS